MALDGDQSIQRNERLLAVDPLSFGIGETNYSQGRVRFEILLHNFCNEFTSKQEFLVFVSFFNI